MPTSLREAPASLAAFVGVPLPEVTAATIPELLESRAASRDGVTLVDRDLAETPLPYSALARGARRAAHRLAAEGVRPGDRVVLLSSTSAPMLVALFGIWRAGAVPVILPLPGRLADPARARQEIADRIAHSGCRCVVAADAVVGTAIAAGLEVPVLACGDLMEGRQEMSGPVGVGAGDLAYLQFTSGTTGSSRAVALTHAQILANVGGTLARLLPELEPPLVHVSWLPLFHDMGLMTLIGALWNDTRLVLQPPEEFLRRPDSWLDALSHYRAASTWAPDFAYALAARSLRERPRELDLSHLQLAGDGAEPIRVDTLDDFLAAGAPYGLRPEAALPMYGLAESTVGVCVGEVRAPMARDVVSRSRLQSERIAVPVEAGTPDARTLVVCGRPIADTSVRIIGEDGRALGRRAVGEICVSGPSLMQGYWQDPDATAAVLRDGWLHTGDLGYLTDDGLVVCGRIKDMVIVGGRNLYPEDYEQVAAGVPGARRTVAAFARPGVERMTVVVEPEIRNGDHSALARAVADRLREWVGHAPEAVAVVKAGSIPLTSSGKVRRGRCRELYLEGALAVLAREDFAGFGEDSDE